MVRNRKVWGVLGLLLALVVMVGYGQPPLQPQPIIDPVAKLTSWPGDLTTTLSQVVRQFARVLGGIQININNAAMWVGSMNPGDPIGVVIIAPPITLSLRPGSVVGLIGVHNIPLGAQPIRSGYYGIKLPPEPLTGRSGRLILVDQAGRDVGTLGGGAITIPPEMIAAPATLPRVHMSMGLQDAVPPSPTVTARICIGLKRANCDCWGIYIEW